MCVRPRAWRPRSRAWRRWCSRQTATCGRRSTTCRRGLAAAGCGGACQACAAGQGATALALRTGMMSTAGSAPQRLAPSSLALPRLRARAPSMPRPRPARAPAGHRQRLWAGGPRQRVPRVRPAAPGAGVRRGAALLRGAHRRRVRGHVGEPGRAQPGATVSPQPAARL